MPFCPSGQAYKKAYKSGKKKNASCLYMWRGVLVTKRLEKKHARVVKGIDSGATISCVGISKSTFSLQHTFYSHKTKSG